MLIGWSLAAPEYEPLNMPVLLSLGTSRCGVQVLLRSLVPYWRFNTGSSKRREQNHHPHIREMSKQPLKMLHQIPTVAVSTHLTTVSNRLNDPTFMPPTYMYSGVRDVCCAIIIIARIQCSTILCCMWSIFLLVILV